VELYQSPAKGVKGKPVVCRIQGFCMAGGTDMALCSDLLVITEDATSEYPLKGCGDDRAGPSGRMDEMIDII